MDNDNFNIVQHIQDNIVGFLLLILSVIIIYTVDRINHFNTSMYATISPIPGIASSIPMPPLKKKGKRR